MIETTIKLKEDINYEIDGIVYEITCPDGFVKELRRSFSNNCAELELFAHLGATVIKLPETKTRTSIKIPGIRIYQKNDKNTIAYLSNNKPDAMKIWYGKSGLKIFLITHKIPYEKPICLPYVPKKLIPDCFEDTIQDTKYQEP